MDDRIDNGLLLGQEELSIEEDDSMYSVIHKTKAVGGELMLGVLSKLYEHGAFPDPLVVNEAEREYFSWPKSADFNLFRERGKKLL
jgi:methionyl-tRNA formyltransferase